MEDGKPVKQVMEDGRSYAQMSYNFKLASTLDGEEDYDSEDDSYGSDQDSDGSGSRGR